MASIYNQVSMSTSATQIIASNASRRRLILRNTGTVTVFVGPDSSIVANANNVNGAYPIPANSFFYLHDYTGVIYGITASGTSTMSVVEEELA